MKGQAIDAFGPLPQPTPLIKRCVFQLFMHTDCVCGASTALNSPVRGIARWQRSGFLSDSDQLALRAQLAQDAEQRSRPVARIYSGFRAVKA